MAETEERNESIVEVELAVERMYRARNEDTTAITVGPGRVKVPHWVAEHWGVLPAETKPSEPKAPAVPRTKG